MKYFKLKIININNYFKIREDDYISNFYIFKIYEKN